MSRMPIMERCRVLGMGVAVSASTSTVVRRRLSFSLCRTPKRCSSSRMNSPKSAKADILLKQPVGADDDVYGAFFYFFDDTALLGRDRKRLRQATFTG
jgi:hypothetical protein